MNCFGYKRRYQSIATFFFWLSSVDLADISRGVHMPNWLPESQMESATFFRRIPVESATFFQWNPRNPLESQIFFFSGIPDSRIPGILGTWNNGIPQSGNLGNPESRNPLAVFWIPCRITKLLSFGYQIKWSKVNFHHRNRIAILKVNFC